MSSQLTEATKPESLDTTSRQPRQEIIDPLAVERCQAVAERLEIMYTLMIEYSADQRHMPPVSLFASVEDFLIAVASDHETNWPRCCYAFLEDCVTLAKRLLAQQGWREGWINRNVFDAITSLYSHVGTLRDPRPVSGPRIITLETLDELIEQNVSPAQIASIYDWLTPDGHPDTGKVKLAIKGEVEVPTQKIIHTTHSKRAPNLAMVDAVVADWKLITDDEPIGHPFDEGEIDEL